jgi:hypothetical protein
MLSAFFSREKTSAANIAIVGVIIDVAIIQSLRA